MTRSGGVLHAGVGQQCTGPSSGALRFAKDSASPGIQDYLLTSHITSRII